MDNTTAVHKREYFIDEAGAKAFNAAFLQLIAERQKEVVAQYMPPENTHRLRHLGAWSHPGAPEAVGGEIQQHSATVETQFQDLIDNDLDTIHRNVRNLLDAMHQHFAQMLYSTVSSACEQTGNTVDAQAAGSVENAFLEVIEKIQFVANKNGEVGFPQLHASPDTAERMRRALETVSPEFKARLDDLTRRKIEEAQGREAERKARFARYGDDA